MHERNIFKEKKPDFDKLALEHKEFSPFVMKGSSGKCYVNFKDPASLRALSLVLLKKYFNIELAIPLDRLIPTIPLRLNYIHWIEDLLANVSVDSSLVRGIDIGCGASCVYAMLGHRMNKWKFVVTEVDEYSANYARDNISQNNMEDFVKLVKVSPTDPPLSAAMINESTGTPDTQNNTQKNSSNDSSSEHNNGTSNGDEHFHFCMCNPPFFDEIHDEPTNRTDHRPPPQTVSTASDNESFTNGGEVEFVKRMIEDSLKLKGKILWYTSMVGRKSSLKPIIRYLKSNNIDSFVNTDFKQGKTMRWGIAWSFTETVAVKKCAAKKESNKKSKPLFLKPLEEFYRENRIPQIVTNMPKSIISDALLKISEVLVSEMNKLGISVEEPARILIQNKIAYEVVGKAHTNTWVHQRRRRREEKKEIGDGSKSKRKLSTNDLAECSDAKRTCLSDESSSVPSGVSGVDGLFEFSLTVGQMSQLSISTSCDVVLSFLCLSGDRDMFYQLFTYFKNVVKGAQLQLKLFV